MAKFEADRNRIAQSLGVSFGDRQHNRNLTVAQCGAVGGQMVKEALIKVGFTTNK